MECFGAQCSDQLRTQGFCSPLYGLQADGKLPPALKPCPTPMLIVVVINEHASALLGQRWLEVTIEFNMLVPRLSSC